MLRKAKWEWTPEDDRRLLEMRAAGRSAISIAVVLRRTPRAIEGRLSVLRKQMGKNMIRETSKNNPA
jgi:hypothetical protein